MKTKDKYISAFLFVALLSCIMSACKKNEPAQDIQIPTVETREIVSKTGSSITVKAQVLSSGGAQINRCGICWSTTHNPNINDGKTEESPTMEAFNSIATGLSPTTKYYIRAYAINEAGIGYGEQIECETYGPPLTDIDGNVYNTVTIGTQIWMVENLKVTRYRNGEDIPLITDDNLQWSNTTEGACAYYNNDIAIAGVYGFLYNWYAATDARNLAPDGWHVPSDADWTLLESFLGGPSVAGGKLKESGTAHWYAGNNGTNEYGFTGLAGGRRYQWASFSDLQRDAYWWTTTQFSASEAKVFHLSYSSDGTCRCYQHMNNGFSVRCVKD